MTLRSAARLRRLLRMSRSYGSMRRRASSMSGVTTITSSCRRPSARPGGKRGERGTMRFQTAGAPSWCAPGRPQLAATEQLPPGGAAWDKMRQGRRTLLELRSDDAGVALGEHPHGLSDERRLHQGAPPARRHQPRNILMRAPRTQNATPVSSESTPDGPARPGPARPCETCAAMARAPPFFFLPSFLSTACTHPRPITSPHTPPLAPASLHAHQLPLRPRPCTLDRPVRRQKKKRKKAAV